MLVDVVQGDHGAFTLSEELNEQTALTGVVDWEGNAATYYALAPAVAVVPKELYDVVTIFNAVSTRLIELTNQLATLNREVSSFKMVFFWKPSAHSLI